MSKPITRSVISVLDDSFARQGEGKRLIPVDPGVRTARSWEGGAENGDRRGL
jgi:hypothetical protein